MPTLTDRDFAKLAATAAQGLVDRGTPLSESVDKLAAEHSMNDEQLRRLCEATNNAAFNAVFEAKGKTGSADRVVEFDVAKPSEILRSRLGAAKHAHARVTKTASAGFDSAWESRPLSSPRDAQMKTASEYESTKTANELALDAHQARRDAIANTRTIDKALSHLRHEKIAAQQSYADATERLYFHFRAMDRKPQFHGFEKDAMALYGDAAEQPLDALRKRLGLPEVNRNYTKVASRVVTNVRASEHLFLKTALDALTRLRDVQLTLDHHARS